MPIFTDENTKALDKFKANGAVCIVPPIIFSSLVFFLFPVTSNANIKLQGQKVVCSALEPTSRKQGFHSFSGWCIGPSGFAQLLLGCVIGWELKRGGHGRLSSGDPVGTQSSS